MYAGRLTKVAAVAAATLALTAGPALARGGGSGSGGGSQTPPAPTPELLCPEYASTGFMIMPDGSTEFANEMPGVLCVIVNASTSNVLTLDSVRTGTGWVANVKSAGGGGSKNKVDVEVTNTSSGERHSILVEPGRTVIK